MSNEIAGAASSDAHRDDHDDDEDGEHEQQEFQFNQFQMIDPDDYDVVLPSVEVDSSSSQ